MENKKESGQQGAYWRTSAAPRDGDNAAKLADEAITEAVARNLHDAMIEIIVMRS